LVQQFSSIYLYLGIPILKSIKLSALTAGLLVMICGCQRHPLFDGSSSSQLQSHNSVTHGDPPGSVPYESIPTPAPTGQLSLADVLSFAELHSPRLAARATDIQIAQARSRQAKRWPNPDLELEMENIAGSGQFSGIDSAETTLSLAQVVPLGGDIAMQYELADVRRGQAQWAFKVARLEVLHQAIHR
jgi:cobalt-zinc-cadmium efflux system outer membrane protein